MTLFVLYREHKRYGYGRTGTHYHPVTPFNLDLNLNGHFPLNRTRTNCQSKSTGIKEISIYKVMGLRFEETGKEFPGVDTGRRGPLWTFVPRKWTDTLSPPEVLAT